MLEEDAVLTMVAYVDVLPVVNNYAVMGRKVKVAGVGTKNETYHIYSSIVGWDCIFFTAPHIFK